MAEEDLLKQILDDSQRLIHVSDFETHTMLYANAPARKFARNGKDDYAGLPCYKFMLNLDKPCSFCPLNKIGNNTTCESIVDNGQQIFKVQTKLTEWNGKKAFIEYATDVTADYKSKKQKEEIKKASTLNNLLKKELKIINALSSSYLNVYLINVKTKKLEIVKLDGYVTSGLDKSKPALYPYDAACNNYISARVYKDDVSMVTDCMKWETMLKAVRENPYYEFSYRVWENEEIHYYQGRYRLVEDNFIVCGFQNIDKIINTEQEQKKVLEDAKMLAEKHSLELARQLSIVKTVSKNFNAIYYINLHNYSFIELGTNVDGVQQVIGINGDARAAFEMMYKHLVLPEWVETMREFTNLDTVNERLRNRPWISQQFCGTLNGWSDGLFIAGNRNADGLCNHIIWATRNIDEAKRKELAVQKELEKAIAAAQSANAAKTDFLFNMSHDIRTPMNAIIGYTDLLEKERNNPEKFADYLKKIRSSNDFLLSLINNVLEMAKIDSGKATLDEKPVITTHIKEEIYDVFHELMKQKNIEFIQNNNIEEKYVFCDIVKLSEIFLNLVSNAYKYTPEGGKITMLFDELPHEQENYVYIKTTISDTGIGMSKEYLPMLFEEFSRERNATDAGIKGTGLGMPIVKKFVELMNGTIDVESEIGKGTTFVIIIPHKIADAPDEAPEFITAEAQKNFTGKRLLLAEDNELNAEIAIELLKELNLEIEHAKDGAICVDMIQKAPAGYYDLVLMDVQMPNVNGYNATRAIRQLEDPAKNQIPIVALTANAFEEDKQNAYQAGMNAHISKPINLPELVQVLNKLLK